MWHEWKVIHILKILFLHQALLLSHLRNRTSRRRLNRVLPTRTRRTYGRSVLEVRELRWPERTPASAGRITHLSRITAAGTESRPITITTGMIPFTTAWVTLAVTIRLSRAMTTAMARIRQALRLATMARAIRSVWHPARNGSAAVTWTRETAHRLATSSAWNGFLRLTRSVAARAIH